MPPTKGPLDKLLAALGLDPVRLRWRLQRWRERSERRRRELENRTRGLSYKNQLCPGCGLPAAPDERRCSRCGRKLHGLALQQLGRLWRLLVPEGSVAASGAFLFVCAAFYLAMVMRSGGGPSLMHGIATPVIIRFGAWTVPAIARGELWRLVTPIFLHFDLLHLIFNGLWLFQLGPLVEQAYGRSRFVVLCLVSGVAGFAASVAYRWESLRHVPVPGGGASGVVFALIGVSLTAGYLKKSRGTRELRAGLGKGLVYGLVFSLLPGVDLMAHLGGGVAGALLGLLLADREQARRVSDRLWLLLAVLSVLVVVASFALVVLRP